MKSTAEMTAALRAAGAGSDVILAALELIDEATHDLRAEVGRLQAADAGRRQRRTEQKRTQREVSREVEATVATDPSPSPPPKRYNQPPSTPSPISVDARARDWFAEEFYPGWPNKVGRAAAERAAVALFRRRRGDMAAVIEGRDRYVREKPADRPWLNPATFLNQERFDDRPAAAPAARARAGPSSADGLEAARQALRERTNGRDHDTAGEQGTGDRDARDGPHDLGPEEQARGRRHDAGWRGPMLDLVAQRSD